MERLSKVGDFGLYAVGPVRAIVFRRPNAGAGRPQAIQWAADLAELIRNDLVERKEMLWRQGAAGAIVARNGVGPELMTPPMLWQFLDGFYCWGTYSGVALPIALGVPGEAQHLEDPDRTDFWRIVCSGDMALNRTSLVTNYQAISALCDKHVPEFGAELQVAMAGALPRGFFAPPAPPQPPAGYARLRALFSSMPLDPASHARLYGYLLGCFHVDSLECPAPLLVVDAWEQEVGKSEITYAIGTILDGEAQALQAPRSAGDVETLVAHCTTGKRVLNLDNLADCANWNNTWIASILSERTGAARAKYSRGTTAFRGRLVTLTGNYGSFSLHKDMLSRAWRIQLWGEAGPLNTEPKPYSRRHRAELVAECYWAARAAPAWAGPSATQSRL
jgi:hypothetical protein